jgi:hypothetical protein
LRNLTSRFVDLADDLTGASKQYLAGLRQTDLAAASINKLRTDIGFNASDKSREGRLGDLQPVRCTAKMQFLAKGDKITKSAQIQSIGSVMVLAMVWFVRHNPSRNAYL